MMDALFKDLRFAFRSLLKRPGFTAVAVITLMLAIGVNTTIFSVVNAVLLRALPFRAPEQLVSVYKPATAGGLPGIAAYQYLAWREQQNNFEDLGAFTDDSFNLTGLGEPERISCAEVTASLFNTLGVQPLRGRGFVAEEDKPRANNVAIVSEAFWQRRFGRDESILNKTVTLNDKPYRIVGVMPAGFRFPGEFDIWLPLALDPVREFQGDMFSLVEVVGRLKTNTNVQAAQTELDLISRNAAQQVKEPSTPPPVELMPLHRQLAGGVRLTVLILWGAVGLVMLLACVNVAGLMISRTLARQREMAVRAAVGARRWQLIRQLLIESVVLGLAGGALGLLIAVWSTRATGALAPEGFATSVYDLNNIPLDWRVFSFTLALSVVAGIVFGLAPALTASKPDLIQTLRNSRSGLMSFGLRSFRGWLVVAELALAMVLLVAAGLLVRSFNKLVAIDTGFDRENVLTAQISLPRSKYKQPEQTLAFQEELLQRLKALPGVQSAGTINHTPLHGFGLVVFTAVEGHVPLGRDKETPIGVGVVSPEYFQTLRIPLMSGRHVDERDGPQKAKVAIVNQAFAQRFFPKGDALGKRVGFACAETEGLCRTIVGVVGNIRQESLTDDVAAELYVPRAQMPMNGMTLFVRTASDPLSFVGAVRGQVLAIDPNQPIYDVKTMARRVSDATAVSRSLTILFAAFALLALVLGSVGIYGIVSYAVTQRTQEIGVRMALGAQTRDILQLILKHGVVLVVSGVAIGVAAAFALTRFLATLLFGITPTDTLTFAIVSLVFFLIAMFASLIPARRATKVDPLIALRYE